MIFDAFFRYSIMEALLLFKDCLNKNRLKGRLLSFNAYSIEELFSLS